MKSALMIAVTVGLLFAHLQAAEGPAAQPAATQQPRSPAPPPGGVCASEGTTRFLCPSQRAEDLLIVPGTDWVLASFAFRAINARSRTTTLLYPTATPRERFDRKTYDTCPGVPSEADKARYMIIGLSLHAGRNAVHTVYATNLLMRTVDVFELDVRGQAPIATWIGCVPAPEEAGLNSVAPLPDGSGFILSSWQPPGGGPDARKRMEAGEINGALWEWQVGKGWSKVPGSETSGANGVEVSRDGRYVYGAGWGNRTFFRVTRGQNPPKRETVQLDYRMDNMHWDKDGSLLTAGHTDDGSVIARVDPHTLKFTELLRRPDNKEFEHASAAVIVGSELWVGAPRGERIAIFPAPR